MPLPTFPIKPVVLPAELLPYLNGKLPDRLLYPVISGSGRLLGRPCIWFTVMRAEAAKAGFKLTYSPGGCYRTYAQQEALFLRRYTQVNYATYLVTALSKRKKWVRNGLTTYWRLNTGMAMAAVPGQSNHGYGLAIDLALGENSATCTPLSLNAINWLYNNAHKYGFSWEHQSEPWHVRYTLGDKNPA